MSCNKKKAYNKKHAKKRIIQSITLFVDRKSKKIPADIFRIRLRNYDKISYIQYQD